MTRREWARLCLQDSGCPDDMLDYHLDRLGIGAEPWTSPDDDASSGMTRHDERAAIRLKVEEYECSLCPRCGGDKGGYVIMCRHCLSAVGSPTR